MKYKLIGLSLLSLSSSINASADIQFMQNNDKVVSMGAPYNSVAGIPLGNKACLKDYSIKYSDIKNDITFTKAISNNELENLMNVKVQGKLGFSKFSGSAKAEYVRSSIGTDYSINANYVEIFSAHVSLVEPDAYGEELLNNKGLGSYRAGESSFIKTCGDSFISEAEGGAMLLVNVSLGFNTRAEKARFESSASAKFGSLASLSGKIDKAAKETGVNGTLTIRAVQFGGDPSRLANIFEKGKDGYYFVECDVSNLDACSKSINGIVDYAKTDFAKQISFNDSDKKITGSEISLWSPGYTDYSSVGLDINFHQFSPQVVSVLQEVDKAYSVDHEDMEFINHLLMAEGIIHFTPDIFNKLKELKLNLDGRLKSYTQNNLLVCSSPMEKEECLNSYENFKIDREDKKVDRSLISFYRNNILRFLTYVDIYLVPISLDGHYSWYGTKGTPLDSIFRIKFDKSKMIIDGNYMSPGDQHHLFSEHAELSTVDNILFQGNRVLKDLVTNQEFNYPSVYKRAVLF